MRGEVHIVNGLDDGAEGGAVINLQRGAIKEQFAGFGKPRQFMKAFDGGTDGVKKLIASEVTKFPQA